MKKNFLLFLFLFLVVRPLYAEIRLWPVPKDEPKSQYWTMSVNGQSAEILTARTADPPFHQYQYGGEYAFVSLDANEPVHLKFKGPVGIALTELIIRPQSLQLVPKKNKDGSFELTVSDPCQFSVELNGREHPLLVFVNPLEKDIPDPGNNTILYGPGIHTPENGIITLKDDQTLYLAPGAIVHCGIQVQGRNIRIHGRGIIDSSNLFWRFGPTPHVVSISQSQNISLEGVIIRGASRWTVVPVNSEGIKIENIKICGGRVQNDDGINPCNSRSVHIRNCFIRTDDDCIAIKGLNNRWGNCEDILIEKTVFWCDRARIVLLGHESRAPWMRRITFRNCDIIHSQERNFLLEPGEKMRLEDLLFEDLRFEMGKENAMNPQAMGKGINTDKLRFDIDVKSNENWLFVGRPVVNQYMKTKVPGHIKNCTIRNITVSGPASYCGILFSGADPDHRTDGLLFENISLFGTKLNADSPQFHIGNYTDHVKIE